MAMKSSAVAVIFALRRPLDQPDMHLQLIANAHTYMYTLYYFVCVCCFLLQHLFCAPNKSECFLFNASAFHITDLTSTGGLR